MAKDPSIRSKARALDRLTKALVDGGVQLETPEDTVAALGALIEDARMSPGIITIVANSRDGTVRAVSHNVRIVNSETLRVLEQVCTEVAKRFGTSAQRIEAQEKATIQAQLQEEGIAQTPVEEPSQTPLPA